MREDRVGDLCAFVGATSNANAGTDATMSSSFLQVLASEKLTVGQYQVLFLLIRDACKGGLCYTRPSFIADELGIDVANVRCAIRGLESKQMVFKQIMKNKGHCYFLNPSYVSVGSDEEESAAQASWNIERIKRIKSIERV